MGRSEFFREADWQWNVFDVLVIGMALVEILLRATGISGGVVFVLRVVKVFRALRLLRVIRFVRHVNVLHAMSLAIANCSMMLVWAVAFLVLLVFLFSIMLIDAASQYISEHGQNAEHLYALQDFYGTLSMTMLTLFMSLTGGVDWWDVVQPLLEISAGYCAVFILFQIIGALAVLNVINATLVNDAMESARKNPDLRIHREMGDMKFMLQRLTALFQDLDAACSSTGCLSLEEFVTNVEREHVKMQFAFLGLYFGDPFTFFKLLDVDRSGSLGIDEFVIGCLRLKSGAVVLEGSVLIDETKTLLHTTSREQMKAHRSLVRIVEEVRDAVVSSSTRRDPEGIKTRTSPRSSRRMTWTSSCATWIPRNSSCVSSVNSFTRNSKNTDTFIDLSQESPRLASLHVRVRVRPPRPVPAKG